MLDDRYARIAKPAGQFIRGHSERCRTGTLAGRRLRIRGGARRVEGDVAFDFLNDLMDMAVQNGDRAKTAQLTHERVRVARTPAPGFIDRPQRIDRGEDAAR